MSFVEGFFIDIDNIYLAHEYVLDRVHKCEYPRGRGLFGVILALCGKAEYSFFTGERIIVCEGDVLFLSPNVAYSIATEKEFRHYTINFDIHEASSNLDALSKPYCLLREKNTEQIERSFKKLVGIWKAKKSGYEMQSIGCLYELLSILYFEYTNANNTASHQRLLIAKEYVEQHFAEPITLERLAYLSNMSVTNFRREWKKLYSETPMQYRDAVRLYYAKEYLNSGYYTVSEVGDKCGFDDVSYFVRFFKKKTGVSPRKFQKQSILF